MSETRIRIRPQAMDDVSSPSTRGDPSRGPRRVPPPAAGGFQAHLVGGGVRDLLLGRPPGDFDVATDAHPPQVMSLFGARYAIPTGLQHGTVTVVTARARRGGTSR